MAKNLRQDITGLRAIAVLAVTLFHIDHVMLPQIDLFKGGFLGVDIFFVISGFLMTMLIMRKGGGLQSGDFSLLKFYQRRAKRICPALIATIVFFLALGYFILSPEDLKNAGREASKAVLFISNYYFASRTGYFDGAATDKLFLHTWSLSVEWQFYIIYPFVMMLAYRFLSYKNVGRLLLGCTILSLGFACYYTTVNANNSYYMLPSRAFELLFGALAYFYPLSYFQNQQSQNSVVAHMAKKLSPATAEGIGITIIIVSLFLVSDQQGWPTLAAIPPLFGTYLCIAAGNQHSLLRATIFQKLGLWSYAIYLVHWPLIVISTKLEGELQWMWLYLVIPIFALGALMHYTIERRRNYGYKFLVLYLALGAATFGVAKTGFPERLSQPQAQIFADFGGNHTQRNGKIEHIGDTSRKPDFILAGDSLANQLSSDLIERQLHVVGIFMHACQSFAHHYIVREMPGTTRQGCDLRYSQLQQAAKQYPDIPIVLAFDYRNGLSRHGVIERTSGNIVPAEDYPQVIEQNIRALADDFKGRDVYVFGQPELQSLVAGQNGRACFFLRQLNNPISQLMTSTIFCQHNTTEQIHLKLNELIASTIGDMQQHQAMADTNGKGSITYLNTADVFCEHGQCQRSLPTEPKIPVLYNVDHYTWAGSVAINSWLLHTIGVEQGKARTEFTTPPQLP